eukprot:7409249-Karenia_brevis.AAC.1
MAAKVSSGQLNSFAYLAGCRLYQYLPESFRRPTPMWAHRCHRPYLDHRHRHHHHHVHYYDHHPLSEAPQLNRNISRQSLMEDIQLGYQRGSPCALTSAPRPIIVDPGHEQHQKSFFKTSPKILLTNMVNNPSDEHRRN